MDKSARYRWLGLRWQGTVVCLLALTLSACGTSAVFNERAYDGVDTIITNVTIIDLEIGTFAPDQMILIGNGEIRGVEGSSRRLPVDLTIIDGEGRFVMPALWDSHAYIFQGPDDSLGTVRSDHILPRYLGYGITHVRNMSAESESPKAFRTKAQSDVYKIISTPLSEESQIISGYTFLEKITSIGVQTIKHDLSGFHGCGPEADHYSDRILDAQLGNSGERIDQVYVAYVNNLDWETCQPVLQQLADDDVAWIPTIGTNIGFADFIEPEVLNSFAADSMCGRARDALRQGGLDAEQDLYDAAATVIRNLNESGLTILAGTDSPLLCRPYGQALPGEVQMLSALGLSRLEALRAATMNPAKVFGVDDRYGRIAPGYEADLVFYESSPLRDISQLKTPKGLYTNSTYLSAAQLERMRAGE